MTLWYNCKYEIPSLSEGDVVEIHTNETAAVNSNLKEVERVEENPPQGWDKRVHFLDGSLIRKSTGSGKWGWETIWQRPKPLSWIEVKEEYM